MRKILILSVLIFLGGCVEESYRTEYYSSSVSDRYYDTVTSGYNRDYQKRHHHKKPRDNGYRVSTDSNSASEKPALYSVQRNDDHGYQTANTNARNGYEASTTSTEQD